MLRFPCCSTQKKSRLFGVLLQLMFLQLSACGRATDQGAHSTPSYATYLPQQAAGGPLGRLEAMRLGLPTDFSTLPVCIEPGEHSMSSRELLLETRLAYATWLAGTGTYGAAEWARLRFSLSRSCQTNDARWAAYVIIPASGAHRADLRTKLQIFAPMSIRCRADASGRRCNGTATTLGLGGPGTLSFYTQGASRRWVKLAAYAPSTTLMSPHINWTSLRATILAPGTSTLQARDRQALANAYDALLATDQPRWEDLLAFTQQLARGRFIAKDDDTFGQLANTYLSGRMTAWSQPYRALMPMFHVLLHEVGHQFGMAHAHAPGLDTMNGPAAGAVRNAAGVWINERAAMAYGLPYLYLTDDDQRGIQANRRQVQQTLMQRR